MRKNIFLTTLFVSFLLMISCSKEEEIDKEKPEIDLSIQSGFPQNCDTLYFGEAFQLKVLFKDNALLGSTSAFSIDIHHNFDHHTHSTEVTECMMDQIKEPINPLTFIQDYDIPENSKEYETSLIINLPSNNNEGLLDEGDYHFFISLTDQEGWSAQKGLSIKILHR